MNADVEVPEAVKDAIENEDIIRIDVLVREFLQNSSLKVLPANQFEDAVIRFIEKGGKETVDEFINETLTKSLDYLVKIDDSKLDNDVEAVIEQCKERLERRWAQAGDKWAPRRKLKPKPDDYDSDMDGPWDDPKIDDRWEILARPAKSGQKGDGEVDMDVSMSEDDASVAAAPAKPAPKKGAAAKGPRGSAAKKAAAPKTRGRPKKQGGFIVDSDDEEEEEEEDDAAMSLDDFIEDDEEDEPPPPPPPPPKRASRATKAAPAKKATATRATASRAAKTAAPKSKQTTLKFSQSQRVGASSGMNQQTLTISDDEIDDDDDDAFEPVQSTRSSRR